MSKPFEPLPHEIVPGVFHIDELQNISLDNAYPCKSYNQGDSASVTGEGLLEHSGYLGFSFGPKTPRQARDKKVAKVLRDGFHPAYQRSTEEASRVANIAYCDSRVSGYIGELREAQSGFKNAAQAWKQVNKDPDERRADANLFLRRHTHEIIGLEGFFDNFNFEGAAAILPLKQIAKSLKTRIVTQRRLNVYDSGAYVASRRGDIWAAINNSRMSDMPYFNYAAPLAGLAIVGTKKQHTANYKEKIVTPVVIGKDNLPYLAPDAFHLPFTLRKHL